LQSSSGQLKVPQYVSYLLLKRLDWVSICQTFGVWYRKGYQRGKSPLLCFSKVVEQEEMDKMVADHRARMQANNDAIAKEKERFYSWRLQKQQEEQKIADTVSHFVTENPITRGLPLDPPAPEKGPVK